MTSIVVKSVAVNDPLPPPSPSSAGAGPVPVALIALALAVVGCAAGCAGATLGQPGAGGSASGGAPAGDGTGGAGTGGSRSGGSNGAGTGGNGTGGARVGGTGGTAVAGTGGASSGSGGSVSVGGTGGSTVGGPPLLGAFTDDFEDGDLTRPATASWRFTVRSAGDLAQWSTVTDGTKVVSQSLAADESELVAGDYRWRDVSIEAKVKHVTADPRAGVCVRYKSPNDKWCLYLESIEQDEPAVPAAAQLELRMRSNLGSASSLPKVKVVDIPNATVSFNGWNTVKLEVHGSQFTAFLNGTMMFQYTDTANLVDSGGVALATESGAIAKFDDVVARPF